MHPDVDVVVAGGGPAGLAAAIAASMGGLSVMVLEKRAIPVDKACGEGLLPSALDALEKLGVRSLIRPGQSAPINSIRFVHDDRTCAEAHLVTPGGLGVRRTILSRTMKERAEQLGVNINERCAVLGWRKIDRAVEVESTLGKIHASILVAADGLNSPLRKAAGLADGETGYFRYGMRRHFKVASPGSSVEVHFGPSAEAYITPVDPHRIGIAFLWSRRKPDERVSFDDLACQFPRLAKMIEDPDPESALQGAGPLAQKTLRQVGDRFVLVGDAAGYGDAITGEGLGLSFESALTLGRILPDSIRNGASRAALIEYERDFAARFRLYSLRTRAMLFLTRHPSVRRQVMKAAARFPSLLDAILKHAGP